MLYQISFAFFFLYIYKSLYHAEDIFLIYYCNFNINITSPIPSLLFSYA